MPVIERVPVPTELLRDCAVPELGQLDTNGDLEQALGEAVLSLRSCNQDKQDIREWQEQE